jgi:hypothetical protein
LIIVEEKIIEDMDLARAVLAETDCSIVVVKDGVAFPFG